MKVTAHSSQCYPANERHIAGLEVRLEDDKCFLHCSSPVQHFGNIVLATFEACRNLCHCGMEPALSNSLGLAPLGRACSTRRLTLTLSPLITVLRFPSKLLALLSRKQVFWNNAVSWKWRLHCATLSSSPPHVLGSHLTLRLH